MLLWLHNLGFAGGDGTVTPPAVEVSTGSGGPDPERFRIGAVEADEETAWLIPLIRSFLDKID